MEVIFHNGCYNITPTHSELTEVLPERELESDILLSPKGSTENPSSGKQFRLRVDPTLEKRVKLETDPSGVAWNKLKMVTLTISQKAYEYVLYTGPFQSEYPETSADILINSY